MQYYLTNDVELKEIADQIRESKHIYGELTYPEAFEAAMLLDDIPNTYYYSSTISSAYHITATSYIAPRTVRSSSATFTLGYNYKNPIVSFATGLSYAYVESMNLSTVIVRFAKINLSTASISGLSSYTYKISVNYMLPSTYDPYTFDNITWYRDVTNTSIWLVGSGAMSGAPSSSMYWNAISYKYVNIDSRITNIASNAFANAVSLKSITGINCTYIGSSAFQSCTSLTTVSFPACTSIYYSAFQSCTSLTTALFPACTSIGPYAFAYCSALTTVSFPVCTSINSLAFFSCSALTTVSFPACTTISHSAFKYCYSLITASFPACTLIYSNAFFGCSALTGLYFLGSTYITASTYMFNATPIVDSTYTGSYGSIYFKQSMLETYKTRAYWSEYSDRMVGLTDAQIAALS